MLYVDQYWGANAIRSSHASDLQRAMWNKRIELIDAVVREEGIDRCGILIHPASKSDEVQFLRERYGEEAVLDLNGVPLEMYFLNGEHCPEKNIHSQFKCCFLLEDCLRYPSKSENDFSCTFLPV